MSEMAVLAAISIINDFELQDIEDTLVKNIRCNDILMKFVKNKYFLLLKDTNVNNMDIIIKEITKNIENKLCIGFASVVGKTDKQVIDEALNNLHIAIKNKNLTNIDDIKFNNFKLYKEEFEKKINSITMPAFYQIKERYSSKLFQTKMEILFDNGVYKIILENKKCTKIFQVQYPGFNLINIDVIQDSKEGKDPIRIQIKPDNYTFEFLSQHLENFIKEYLEEIR